MLVARITFFYTVFFWNYYGFIRFRQIDLQTNVFGPLFLEGTTCMTDLSVYYSKVHIYLIKLSKQRELDQPNIHQNYLKLAHLNSTVSFVWFLCFPDCSWWKLTTITTASRCIAGDLSISNNPNFSNSSFSVVISMPGLHLDFIFLDNSSWDRKWLGK